MRLMPLVSETARTLTNLRVTSTLLVFLMTVCATSRAGTVPPGSDTTFRSLLLTRIQAYGRGDVTAYMGMLSDQFVHISDLGERRTRNQMAAFVSGHGNNRTIYDIPDLTWRIENNLAIVNARIREHRSDFDGRFSETDIFVWRGGRWLYQLHQETAVCRRPVAVTVSEDRLDDYAGRWKTATGTIDVITVKSRFIEDRTVPEKISIPMVHIARGAFGFADDPTLVVFLRDRNGAVTQCLWHLPSGQTVVSRKVK